MNKFLSIIFVLVFFISGCAGLGVVTVATVGAVIHYKSLKHEVATVNLHAEAQKVYNVALQTIEKNKNAVITSKDDESRLIEISREDKTASMKVTAMRDGYSQLTITSDAGTDSKSGTQLVLDGVLRVCKELNVECTVIKE